MGIWEGTWWWSCEEISQLCIYRYAVTLINKGNHWDDAVTAAAPELPSHHYCWENAHGDKQTDEAEAKVVVRHQLLTQSIILCEFKGKGKFSLWEYVLAPSLSYYLPLQGWWVSLCNFVWCLCITSNKSIKGSCHYWGDQYEFCLHGFLDWFQGQMLWIIGGVLVHSCYRTTMITLINMNAGVIPEMFQGHRF